MKRTEKYQTLLIAMVLVQCLMGNPFSQAPTATSYPYKEAAKYVSPVDFDYSDRFQFVLENGETSRVVFGTFYHGLKVHIIRMISPNDGSAASYE
jgi:hypothetical protein